MELIEVVTNNSSEFTTINQNQELWFDSGIKVELNRGSSITVNSDMLELLKLIASIFVVLLNLFANRVPLGSEIEQCEGWSGFIQMLD